MPTCYDGYVSKKHERWSSTMTEKKSTTATDTKVEDYMLDGTIPYRTADDGQPVNYGGFYVRDGVACCRGCSACVRDNGVTGAHCGLNGRYVFQWQPCSMELGKDEIEKRLAKMRAARSYVIAYDDKGCVRYDSFVDPEKVIKCKDCPARRDSSLTKFMSERGACALTGESTNDYWECNYGFDIEEVERRLGKIEVDTNVA